MKSTTWGSSEARMGPVDFPRSLPVGSPASSSQEDQGQGLRRDDLPEATSPDKNESAWIKEKLQILEAAGIPFHADGTLSDDDAKWLRELHQVSRPRC